MKDQYTVTATSPYPRIIPRDCGIMEYYDAVSPRLDISREKIRLDGFYNLKSCADDFQVTVRNITNWRQLGFLPEPHTIETSPDNNKLSNGANPVKKRPTNSSIGWSKANLRSWLVKKYQPPFFLLSEEEQEAAINSGIKPSDKVYLGGRMIAI